MENESYFQTFGTLCTKWKKMRNFPLVVRERSYHIVLSLYKYVPSCTPWPEFQSFVPKSGLPSKLARI